MKSKKHLSKSKRIIISAMATVCALSSAAAISAGAVEKVSTGSVYMCGYELYGSLTLYPTYAYGYTYCERANTNTGKSAQTYFAYKGKDGQFYAAVGGSSGYTYSNSTGLSIKTPNIDTSNFQMYLGAMTISKVQYKDQPHYTWTSEGTDNELRLGYYKR